MSLQECTSPDATDTGPGSVRPGRFGRWPAQQHAKFVVCRSTLLDVLQNGEAVECHGWDQPEIELDGAVTVDSVCEWEAKKASFTAIRASVIGVLLVLLLSASRFAKPTVVALIGAAVLRKGVERLDVHLAL
jgi:hypothetical protein